MEKLMELPRCPGKPLGLYVQQYGRAWRPGNKPRIYWNAAKWRWEYNTASILRMGRVCTDREIDVYSKIIHTLNRSNGHAF